MVALYLDKEHRNLQGHLESKFKVLFRLEIPRTEFTYVNAVNKIVELNDIIDFDWIAVDKGYGETQIELLHQYGIANPQSGLADKVVGYQFGQKIEVRDPHTHKKDSKPLKPFMVNNSVITFEKMKLVLDPTDKLLIEQLESYRIETISKTGLPTYSSENEHAVDGLNLCLLIIEQKYGSLFKSVISSKILGIKQITRNENVLSRSVAPNTNVLVDDVPKKTLVAGFGNKNSFKSTRSFCDTETSVGRMYKRSSF